MFINTTGIVLREVAYKDNAKILTVLTSGHGKLTVSAYGAHGKKSKLASSTGLFVFSHMTLTERSGRWTLTEAQIIEQFLGLRDDLCCLSLASYIAELTETVADEDSLNPELLPLCLNALYALSEANKPPELVKPAFELRLMAIAGYEPVLILKEKKPEDTAGVMNEQNAGGFREGTLCLSAGALSAARYILTCDSKKLLSFRIESNGLKELAEETETYLLTHLDKSFRTLDYYKKTNISTI